MDGAPQAEVVVCSDADDLAVSAARRIAAAAEHAISMRGRFTWAISGGSTPQRTYSLLVQPQWKTKIDWSRTFIFMGDERFVSPDDERSNYGAARRALLEHVEIPATDVFPVQTDTASAAEAAGSYEAKLRDFFKGDAADPRGAGGGKFPAVDLNLLGLGDDGHTASLFPGKPTLDEEKLWVTWSTPGTLPPPVDRVTFTLPMINASREIVFLVSGAGKAGIVREVLEGPRDVHRHPATGVKPTNGKLAWLLDEAASSKLSPKWK